MWDNGGTPTRRNKQEYKWNEIPTIEWKKRLGLAPDDVIDRTIEATTQHYLEVEGIDLLVDLDPGREKEDPKSPGRNHSGRSTPRGGVCHLAYR